MAKTQFVTKKKGNQTYTFNKKTYNACAREVSNGKSRTYIKQVYGNEYASYFFDKAQTIGSKAVPAANYVAKATNTLMNQSHSAPSVARVGSSGASGLSRTASTIGSSSGTGRVDNSASTVNDLLNRNISGTYYEDIANKNNALSVQMNRENNAFNAKQAQLQRDYETMMANTAHQREVQDLQAAGLNPILSAGGTGAVTPNGASASASNFTGVDQTIISALAGLASSTISANAQMTAASTQAAATQAAAAMNSGAMMYSADQARSASQYNAQMSYNASKYRTDKDFITGMMSASADMARALNIFKLG